MGRRSVAMVVAHALAARSSKDSATVTADQLDHTRAVVRRIAYELYPRWASIPSHTGRCPGPADLAEWVEAADFRDPWGEALRISCQNLPPGALGIAISSNGPDRQPNTPDDIRSWMD